MNDPFWKSDWFVGASLSFVFLVVWWWGTALLQGLERDAYDLGVRMSSRDPGGQVTVVAIDDKSIQNIGRWPWSREIHANENGGDKLVHGSGGISQPRAE